MNLKSLKKLIVLVTLLSVLDGCAVYVRGHGEYYEHHPHYRHYYYGYWR